MKKYLFRLIVSVCAIILVFGAIGVSAATGIYDGTVRFPCIIGDVNDDGNVDIADLVRFDEYLDDNSIDIFKSASDIDDNGEYNSNDLMELMNILIKK